MAIKSFTAITQDIINNIATVDPTIDVKIGAVVRDIFIDVQAAQLQNLYALVDYSSKGQSVLTARGAQLDRLAYNSYQKRLDAKRSVGAVTLVIKNGLSAPTLLNVGEQFYTGLDQSGQVVTFILASAFLLPANITQITLPIISLDTGVTTIVPAYSITRCNLDFVDEVYNAEPTTGGADQESDDAFASRIPIAVTGFYSNVYNGILKLLSTIDNVGQNPHIVTPDNSLARGPYSTDVYLQRSATYYGTPVVETGPANQSGYTFNQQPLYDLNPINQITYYDPTSGQNVLVPPSVNGSPQYQVINDPTDTANLRVGSINAGQQLQWLISPPSVPYTIDYNLDQTIVDAQTALTSNTEIVADVLFRQSRAVPLYCSFVISAAATANILTVQQNAGTNLGNVFGGVTINQSLSQNNIVYAILSDKQNKDVTITNLDTAVQVTLTGSFINGLWVFTPTFPSSTYLTNHPFTPMGVYYDNTPSTSIFQIPVLGRLFLGNPQRILQSVAPNLDPTVLYPGTGVTDADLVQNIRNSWGANMEQFYDPNTQTLAVNFTTVPSLDAQGNPPTITFNLVQPLMSPASLTYLALAPSLVQPIVPVPAPATFQGVQPYLTVLPQGCPSTLASVYKNGIRLIPSVNTNVTVVNGDYSISLSNGIYTIYFKDTPQDTDVLQFGLLNPDLSIAISS